MRRSLPVWLGVLGVLTLAGCAAAPVAIAPDAVTVRTGTEVPPEPYLELGAITASHGGGCGGFGTQGNYEGAYTILRNKARSRSVRTTFACCASSSRTWSACARTTSTGWRASPTGADQAGSS